MIDGKWNYEIKRSAKTMKEPCNCKFKNEVNSKLKYSDFTNDQRNEVFKLYWDLDKSAKTQFITNYTTVTAISRKRTLEIQSRRNSSIEYYLPANTKRIRICQTMFLNTLGISDKIVRSLVCNENVISNNDIDNDLDSVHFTNVIEANNVSERKELLHEFLDSLNNVVTLANGLLNLSILTGVTILQKFLQRGHTQMEVDSMHSTIERKIRNKKINVPADYVSICKSVCTKSPYTVEYLSHNFFKSFISLQYCKSIRPGNKKGDPVVTNIKALMYEPQKQINYKLGFSED